MYLHRIMYLTERLCKLNGNTDKYQTQAAHSDTDSGIIAQIDDRMSEERKSREELSGKSLISTYIT